MRILHVTPYYHPAAEWGGPVRSVALLAQATARAGVHVEVVTTSRRGSVALAEVPPGTREVDGVPVTYCHARGPRRFFFSPQLAAEVRRRVRRADVVHLHGIWTYPVVAAARACEGAGVPYVLSPRGSLDPWALRQKSWKKRLYTLLVERHTIHGAALLHFTSADEQRTAPSAVRALPHVVVPNCLDLDRLLSLDRREAGSRAPEVLVLGRIHPMKGFDVLVPAFRRLVDGGRSATLMIAGNDEGGYRRVVERLVAEHRLGDRVRFLGELDGPGKEEAFARAALLVAPSYRENFGNAVAEAMAAGLPVIVSERVGIAADIADARAGLVVPIDAGAVASALGRLLAEPAAGAAMGARGRTLARGRYAGPAVAATMIAAYALAGSGLPPGAHAEAAAGEAAAGPGAGD
jgi:glycosyltransferase involved in cell wall biosynthesis